MWIDTHVHFDAFAEQGSVGEALSRAAEAGVARMVAIGGSKAANDLAVLLAGQYPERIRAAVGFDRDQHGTEHAHQGLSPWIGRSGVVAVGEIGLDYYYGADSAAEQKKLLACMLNEALQASLPVVVHSRYADKDTLDLLSHYVKDCQRAVPGVLHCFTGDLEFAGKILDLGFMISFSGIVTFRNADELRAVVPHVPDERLLLETDTPYLAPMPYRGRTNEPSFLPAIAQKIAEIKQLDLTYLAEITTHNADRLFAGMPKEPRP